MRLIIRIYNYFLLIFSVVMIVVLFSLAATTQDGPPENPFLAGFHQAMTEKAQELGYEKLTPNAAGYMSGGFLLLPIMALAYLSTVKKPTKGKIVVTFLLSILFLLGGAISALPNILFLIIFSILLKFKKKDIEPTEVAANA